MQFTKNQLIIIFGGLAFVLVIGAIFYFGGDVNKGPTGTITMWGVFDGENAWRDFDAAFGELQPGIMVEYIKKNEQTYEQDLISALASGQGPDVFMVHNSWIPKHYGKMTPAPASILTVPQLRELFPTVVEQDFAPDNTIFALPLYIDTLALYWNKDYFDRKGIAAPPATWDEFARDVSRLREIDSTRKILSAGAAFGGSTKSVNRMSDILSLLMLQNGTPMTSQDFRYATFAETRGTAAVEFYAQFANPVSSVYTWNDSQHYSIDAFAEGNVAMMLNYAYQTDYLKNKNPFLNFAIAPVPQLKDATQPLDVANYWGIAVSKQAKRPDLAWLFVKDFTTNAKTASTYMKTTGRPPALRALISEVDRDPMLGIFARQALIARSWPQIDNLLVEKSFSTVIEAVLSGRLAPASALQEAKDTISARMMAQ